MKPHYLLLFLFIGALAPMKAVVMELRENQVVIGNHLTLNDLLQSSQGITSDQLALVVASTPALGKSQFWTRAQIEAVLPLSLKNHPVEWIGATCCQIKRPSVEYGAEEVRQLISDEMIKHLIPGDEFEILEFSGFSPFPIPEGELKINVTFPPGATRNEWTQATLEFHSEGQLAVSKTVRFHWILQRKVWQATSPIKVGDELTSNSFQQVPCEILKLPNTAEPAQEFPTGKVSVHALAQGKILMANDWAEPRLVSRNDLVTVIYNHHGVSITLQAKALQNGTQNEVIQVQNLSSNKIFNARVMQERTLVYDE